MPARSFGLLLIVPHSNLYHQEPKHGSRFRLTSNRSLFHCLQMGCLPSTLRLSSSSSTTSAFPPPSPEEMVIARLPSSYPFHLPAKVNPRAGQLNATAIRAFYHRAWQSAIRAGTRTRPRRFRFQIVVFGARKGRRVFFVVMERE